LAQRLKTCSKFWSAIGEQNLKTFNSQGENSFNMLPCTLTHLWQRVWIKRCLAFFLDSTMPKTGIVMCIIFLLKTTSTSKFNNIRWSWKTWVWTFSKG
jgi:hypothetical protein